MKIFLAPMVGRTDRYFRSLIRIISPNITLFTEMITVDSLIRGKRSNHLITEDEHPIIIQLAGDDKKKFLECSQIAEDLGYDEINLNIGCPSNKVIKGGFGACQIIEPEKVSDYVYAINRKCKIPISIKTRLGLGFDQKLDDIIKFIEMTSNAGCKIFYIHARNAILNGLSTRKNRSIPPLRYDDVIYLKNLFPNLKIYINGGFEYIEDIEKTLKIFDGIMIGRKIYNDPMFLTKIDELIFSSYQDKCREKIINQFLDKLTKDDHCNKKFVLRHLTNLYFNTSLSKKWKKFIHNLSNSDRPLSDLRYFSNEKRYEEKKVVST